MPDANEESSQNKSQNYSVWLMNAVWVLGGLLALVALQSKQPLLRDMFYVFIGIVVALRTIKELGPKKRKDPVFYIVPSMVLLLICAKIYIVVQDFGFKNALEWMAVNWYFILAILWLPIMLLIWLFFERRRGQLKIKE